LACAQRASLALELPPQHGVARYGVVEHLSGEGTILAFAAHEPGVCRAM
jgi:hypothetical protein